MYQEICPQGQYGEAHDKSLSIYIIGTQTQTVNGGGDGEHQQQQQEDNENAGERLYNIREIGRRINKRFKVEEVLYRVTSTQEARNETNPLNTLFTMLRHLIGFLTRDLNHNDRIQLTLSDRDTFDYPISLPLLKICELSIDELFKEIMRIVQSNSPFKIGDNLEIRVVLVRIPVGGKTASRRSAIAAKWMRKSHSIVTVTNRDNMCMARAIGICIAKLVNKMYKGKWGQGKPGWLTNNSRRTNFFLADILWGESKYDSMKKAARRPQEKFATWLHETADVPQNRPCDLAEAEKFQSVLDKMGISLNIFSQPYAGSIIFGRPKEHERHIYIYHRENHYDAVVSVTGLIRRGYWCPKCSKGYDERTSHFCSNICKRCQKPDDGECQGEITNCGDCNRYFLGEECFDYHKQHGTCNSMKHCPTCQEFLKSYRSVSLHRCGFKECKVCEQFYKVEDGRHHCYMPVVVNPYLLKKKKKKKNRRRQNADDDDDDSNDDVADNHDFADEVEVDQDDSAGDDGAEQTQPVYDPDNFQFIFFDFETVTKFDPDAPDMKHCVQVAVAVSVCQDCKDAPVTETCDNCQEKEVIFYGRDSLQKFCDWLFDNRKGQWTAFAHNAQDEYFILNIYIYAYIHNL